MTRYQRPTALLSVGMMLWVVFSALAQDTSIKTKQSVPKNEQLRFDQEKVRANMRELEDRMIKLAELLRDAKPDDSARLLLGVENARQNLILEQMHEISVLLDSVELETATAEQKQVIQKLQKLKELLLNADLDLRIKLEQLKRIKNVRRKLAELIEKETQQKAATQQAEQKQSDTSPLQQNERRNQRASENLQQQVNRIAGSGAASKAVGSAGQSMGQAGQCLGNGNCNSASQSQQEAINKLKEAEKKLADLKQKLQQQAEAAARQRVMELLADMIDRQTKIKVATEDAVPRVIAEDPSVAAALTRLSQAEEKIIQLANECIEICDLTEFSFVLPEALREVRSRMDTVHSQLELGSADDNLVIIEQAIVDDLKELLDAMKQGSKPGSPSNSQCQGGGCASNRNKLLAEVRMLYWMQKAVSRKTREVRKQEVEGQLSGDALQAKSKEMQLQQEKIREVTRRLRELTNPGFVNGDAI